MVMKYLFFIFFIFFVSCFINCFAQSNEPTKDNNNYCGIYTSDPIITNESDYAYEQCDCNLSTSAGCIVKTSRIVKTTYLNWEESLGLPSCLWFKSVFTDGYTVRGEDYDTIAYTKGTNTYIIENSIRGYSGIIYGTGSSSTNCIFNHVGVDTIIVDGPILFQRAFNFLYGSSSNFSCNLDAVIFTIYYSSYDNGLGEYKLQVYDYINKGWADVKNLSSSGGAISLTYNDDLSSIISLSDTNTLYFRTKKKYYRDAYHTAYTYSYYKTNLRYLEPVNIDAEDIKYETPHCPDDIPIIKIPASSASSYTITISPFETEGQTQTFQENTVCPDSCSACGYSIKDDTIIIDNSTIDNNCNSMYLTFDTGKLYYTIENTKLTTCKVSGSIDVPTIETPNIAINGYGFTATDDTNIHIKKNGGTGSIYLNITNSRSNSATITIGNKDTTVILPTSTPNGTITYYSKSNIEIPGISSGTYNINAVNGYECSFNTITNVKFLQPARITYLCTPNNSCPSSYVNGNNGTITINNISGGLGNYVVSISSGSITYNSSTNTATAQNLAPGTYTITIQDTYNGTHYNDTNFTITIGTKGEIPDFEMITTEPTLSCLNNGSISFKSPTESSGFQVSKDNISFNQVETISGYSSGRSAYYIKADSTQCIEKRWVYINYKTELNIDDTKESITLPTCYNGNDGTFTVPFYGVYGTLSVYESNIDSIYIVDDTIVYAKGLSSESNYNFTIRDMLSANEYCDDDESFTIPNKNQISITSCTPHNVANKGKAEGSCDINFTTSNTGIHYVYLKDSAKNNIDTIEVDVTDITSNTVTFINLYGKDTTHTDTTYFINIEDTTCKCSYENDHNNNDYGFFIYEPQDTLTISYNIRRPIPCYNETGSVDLSATGGWGNYQYKDDVTNWTTDSSFNGYTVGSYYFYVKDDNGNGGTDTILVTFTQPDSLIAYTDSIHNVTCFGLNNGFISYKITGGTFPYHFSNTLQPYTLTDSSASDTIITAVNLAKADYEFYVVDTNGCITAALLDTITQPDLLQVDFIDIVHTTCELDNAILSTQAIGGTVPYTYQWKGHADDGYNFDSTQTGFYDTDTCVITQMTHGTYNLFITDSNECADSSLHNVILDYRNPEIDSTIITDVHCYGESNGEIQVITKDYSDTSVYPNMIDQFNSVEIFTLNNTRHTYADTTLIGQFTGLIKDTFALYVFDSIGCRSDEAYYAIVNQPDTAIYLLIDSIMPVINKGEASGTIISQTYGGNIGLKTIYLIQDSIRTDSVYWPSQKAIVHNQLYAGYYSIEAVDLKGCTFIADSLEVIEPDTALGFIVLSKTDARCKSMIGSFSVQGFGGWGDYSYKRGTDNAYSVFNGFEKLYAGSYRVTVKDHLGGTFTDTVNIVEPKDSLFALFENSTPPTCGNNGDITIHVSGGTEPYRMYHEFNADTVYLPTEQSYTYDSLEAKNYLVSINDTNGCIYELETELTDSMVFNITELEILYPSENGASDGGLVVHTSGGIQPITYTWNRLNNQDLDTNNDTISGLYSGYYRVDATESNGCTQTDYTYLPNISDLELELVSLTHETGYNAQNGTAILTAGLDSLTTIDIVTPDPEYLTYGINETAHLFYFANDTLYMQNLAGGKYIITVTNTNDSTATAEFTIEPYEYFYIYKTTVTPVIQKGEPQGKIIVEVAGGGGENSFTWNNLKDIDTHLNYTTDANTTILSKAYAGDYGLSVTDQYGNTITDTIAIKEPDKNLQISIKQVENRTCKDVDNAYIVLSASGGWGSYQYKDDRETYFYNATYWDSLEVRENYFYTTDKLGAIDSIKITITEPDSIRASLLTQNNVRCNGDKNAQVKFDVEGGTPSYLYQYLEYPVVNYWKSGKVVQNLGAGKYSFIFTDQNNCESQDTVVITITEPDSLLLDAAKVVHTSCEKDNGSININMKGGTTPYTYQWMTYSGFSSTNSAIDSLAQSETYFLTVTDALKCKYTYMQRINSSSKPKIATIITDPTLCYGDSTGKAEVTAVQDAEPYTPYYIQWDNGITGLTSSGYPAGSHAATVIDTNKCESTAYFTIESPTAVTIESASIVDAQCYGYSNGSVEVTPAGGVGNYSLLWSNGITTALNDAINKGDYTVVVSDSNDCSYEKTYTVNEPDQLIVDLGDDTEICSGESIMIDGQDFNTHSWSIPSGFFSDERKVRVYDSTTLYLEVTNAAGCYAWDTISIAINDGMLQADFLMTSESFLNDTLSVYELSSMTLDSMIWEYPDTAFTNITGESEPDYVLQLMSQKEGTYDVVLWAYANGCTSYASKSVNILPESDTADYTPWLGYQDPIIEKFVIAPNPNSGTFSVMIELTETEAVEVSVYNLTYGQELDRRNENGLDNYTLSYELNNLNPGSYLVTLAARNERRQIKMIIE